MKSALDVLERSRQALARAEPAVAAEAPEEFVLADLQEARAAREEITGAGRATTC